MKAAPRTTVRSRGRTEFRAARRAAVGAVLALSAGGPTDVSSAATAGFSASTASPNAATAGPSAAAALEDVVRLDGEAVVSSHQLFAAVAGWPLAPLGAAEAAFLGALVALVARPRAHVFAALRAFLAPGDTLRALFSAGSLKWRQAKEVYLAACLAAEVGAGRVDAAALRELRRPERLHPRAAWAAAFGAALPTPTEWGQPAPRDAFGLLERVQAARGALGGLSLQELLILSQPSSLDPAQSCTKLLFRDATQCPCAKLLNSWHTDARAGWVTPFSFFAHHCVHFAEVLTAESVTALARYLGARAAGHVAARSARGAPGAPPPILEIGAGGGRLAHHLNASGLLGTSRVVATDPTPTNYARKMLGDAEAADFAVEQLDDVSAIAAHAPELVLCSFMGVGQDWAARWRERRVTEYVLVGTLGSGEGCYRALNDLATPGYSRTLLRDVSAHLLDAHACARAPAAAAHAAPAQLCAVSFRRLDS